MGLSAVCPVGPDQRRHGFTGYGDYLGDPPVDALVASLVLGYSGRSVVQAVPCQSVLLAAPTCVQQTSCPCRRFRGSLQCDYLWLGS